MCCDDQALVLPPKIEEMLSGYRAMHSVRPTDWGADWSSDPQDAALALPCWLPVPLVGWLRGRPELGQVADGSLSLGEALRRCIGGGHVQGVATLRVGPDGPMAAPLASLPWSLAARTATVDLLVISDALTETLISLPAREEHLGPGECRLLRFEVSDPTPGLIEIGLGAARIPVTRVAVPARLHLRSSRPLRWSVSDDAGGGWFAAGSPGKWDSHGRPFFHARSCVVEVPAGHLDVSATNGIGSRPVISELVLPPEVDAELALEPERRFDPRAEGWHGADLHVHANISGDLVISPGQARCMQAGEDLDLLHLLASNLSHELVYDREALEATLGRDLPGPHDGRVTRFGAEVRNDLLGHVHALGLRSAPSRYQTGHVPAAGQEDWPPNAHTIEELREAGALVGYCHPVWSPLGEDDPVEPFAGRVRSVEARELVADAARGLVDSIELISNADPEGTIRLYHRLLDCGLRLAAVAGTDTFLSFSHGFNSDPPGWARVYAHLDGAPPSVAAFAAAIRRGATLATNGPWVTLEVNGQGPGSSHALEPGTLVSAQATARGPGVRALRLVGPDGVLAETRVKPGGDGDRAGTFDRAEAADEADEATLSVVLETRLEGPSWLAAHVVGVAHPEVLQHAAVAHTTPVYLDVAGERVARAASARWCLRWLDHLERLAREHGRFAEAAHRDDLVAVIAQARAVYRDVEQRALSRGAAPG